LGHSEAPTLHAPRISSWSSFESWRQPCSSQSSLLVAPGANL
jgi:hypothetical protein